VTLFEFGRTIRCTCGERVGLEARVVSVRGRDRPPRFAADDMLGRLARWLRALGHDTVHEPTITDAELVRRAIAEQLSEVDAQVHLSRDRPFTRCLECNALLEGVARDEVAGRLPESVLRDHDRFWRCPHCQRAYWDGSHTRRMREALARTLPLAPALR
jgi:hypothetical protein